jgi:hypothetical protein
MFTGIVEEIGTVRAVQDDGGDLRVRIEAGAVLQGARIGDSIAVSGLLSDARGGRRRRVRGRVVEGDRREDRAAVARRARA